MHRLNPTYPPPPKQKQPCTATRLLVATSFHIEHSDLVQCTSGLTRTTVVMESQSQACQIMGSLHTIRTDQLQLMLQIPLVDFSFDIVRVVEKV